MGACRNDRIGLAWLSLALFLLNAALAFAVSSAYPLQIKVLSAEFHALETGTPVPKDCDLQNFSAYCNESRNPTVQNVMVVQDSNGKSFTIECTVDSRWSKCAPLRVGETFDARKEKRGITVLYRDPKGKEKKQFYELLASAPATPASAAAQPKPQSAAPPQSSLPPAPAPPVDSGHIVAPEPVAPEKAEQVKCNFSSTPSGAEITLDGKYVGNTPSEIAVASGTHVVVISLAGFAEWKRELTVAAGSIVVNVTASLQRTQP